MSGIRVSQRAPKSCLDCTRRKVRCDKKIPCNVCIRRGVASSCAREEVEVKTKQEHPTYGEMIIDDLAHGEERQEATIPPENGSNVSVQENDPEELPSPNTALYHLAASPRDKLKQKFVLDDSFESFERHLFELVSKNKPPNSVTSEFDVEFPSRSLSEYMVQQGKHTVWAHFAIHYPIFASQHAEFWASCDSMRQMVQYDPFWLALYFSFLSAVLVLNDKILERLEQTDYMSTTTAARLRKWHDCALFYLQKADFLRYPDLRTVQTIAILSVVFKNVGEFHLYQMAMPIAVRTAQILRIDQEAELRHRHPVEQEICRRIWWTIVVCEWLPIPYLPACVGEYDFDVSLPSVSDDDELLSDTRSITTRPQGYPRQIHFHIGMIESAIIYRRLFIKLKHGNLDQAAAVELVIRTDEELANLIQNLPPYLQGDSDVSWINDDRFPWIPAQRVKLSVFILSLRGTINKTLQNIWSENGAVFQRTRSICLKSSEGIIALVTEDRAARTLPFTWGVISHLFSAAVTLAIEAEINGQEDGTFNAVDKCKALFQSVRSWNPLASAALQILETITHPVG